MYREVGTLVHVKPEVSGDGLVTIELRIQDSRMRTPEDGIILGEEGKGTPLRAAEMGICNVESRVQIRSGKVVLVEGAKTNSKAGSAQELILITASLE
jgi:type II secretory pathway component GspD/PulD (secretin)